MLGQTWRWYVSMATGQKLWKELRCRKCRFQHHLLNDCQPRELLLSVWKWDRFGGRTKSKAPSRPGQDRSRGCSAMTLISQVTGKTRTPSATVSLVKSSINQQCVSPHTRWHWTMHNSAACWQMLFGGEKTEELSRGAAAKRCRNLLFFFFPFLQINNSQFNSSLFPTLPAPALPFSANHKTRFHSQAAVTQVNFQFILTGCAAAITAAKYKK